jgi:hypothetical protein
MERGVIVIIAFGSALVAAAYLLWVGQYILGVLLVCLALIVEELPRLGHLVIAAGKVEIDLERRYGRSTANKIQRRVRESMARIERDKGVKLTEASTEVITNTILDSLVTGVGAWKERDGLDLNDPKQLESALKRALESAEKVVQQAEPADVGEVPVAKVNKSINQQWCRIPPFCTP